MVPVQHFDGIFQFTSSVIKLIPFLNVFESVPCILQSHIDIKLVFSTISCMILMTLMRNERGLHTYAMSMDGCAHKLKQCWRAEACVDVSCFGRKPKQSHRPASI